MVTLRLRTYDGIKFLWKNKRHVTPIHDLNNNDISQFFGQSSFAYHAVVDENNVVKVTTDVDLRLLGPLGCGIMTGSGTILNSLQPKPGSSLVVFGTGAVGLSALMALKLLDVLQSLPLIFMIVV